MIITEKVIIRNRIYKPSEISINMDFLKDKLCKESIENYHDLMGDKEIVKIIYDEDIDSDELRLSSLYNDYSNVLSSGIENSSFFIAYKISEDMAVKINEHIYIMRIVDSIFNKRESIVPWYCMESNIYIADSWWEKDEDIIHDLSNLTYLEFLKKYKMY